MKINLSGVTPQAGFEPLPASTYHVKITDCTWKEASEASKNPGAPLANIEYTVQDGPYAERKVWENITVVDTLKPRIKALMIALGFTAEAVEGDIDFAPEEWTGRDVMLVLSVRGEVLNPDKSVKYQASNNVVSYKPFGGATSSATGQASLLPS